MMTGSLGDVSLSRQLLEVAGDPVLRESVYLQLGEYCHQCRNRLNSLKLSLFLAMKQASDDHRDAWGQIELHYLELEQIVDRLQTICRPMTLSKVTIPLDLLFDDRREEWSRVMAEGGGDLELIHPRMKSTASFDVERMAQALDALVRWRAGGRVRDRVARLRWGVEAGRAQIAWEELEVSPTEQELGGTTWTLPLVARVAQAHGGQIRCSDEAGWRLEINWPATPDTP